MQMTPALWIGFGFLTLLIFFLIYLVISKNDIQPSKLPIVRYLTALSGAFAGGFITGDALFKMDTQLGNGTKVFISGTAGFAMFLIVLYFIRFAFTPKSGFNITPPVGSNFKQVVHLIAQADKCLFELVGFSEFEQKTELDSQHISAANALEAMTKLKYLSNRLPPYTVKLEQGVYIINKKV